MRLMAAWCRKSPAAPIWKFSTGLIERALDDAGIALNEVDAIAATAGPGLIGGVMVGLTMAKALALASGKPLIAVNHLAGHALTARLTHGVEFPFLLLLVSGGHCQLLAVAGAGELPALRHHHRRRGGRSLRQDGEDSGPALSRRAECGTGGTRGNPRAYPLPRPLLGRAGMDFSFSGLKTAVRQLVGRRTR